MQTMSEQMLSRAAGHPVVAGDVVTVAVDLVMMHDSLAPGIIKILHDELGVERVWDPTRVAVVIDHVAPAASRAGGREAGRGTALGAQAGLL